MPLTISDEQLQAMKLSESQARIEIACRLYDAGKMSTPAACTFTGPSRVDFETELSKRGLPWIHLDWDESYAEEFGRIAREGGAKEQTGKSQGSEQVPIVVSDTSAIAALDHLGLMNVVATLYGIRSHRSNRDEAPDE